MIKDAVMREIEAATFDYTSILHPREVFKNEVADALRYKEAVANILKPNRILEVGIRAGYSAAAFLHARPEARYVGMDINKSVWGGHKGMILHAKAKLKELYPQAHITIHEVDSHSPEALDRLAKEQPFDLIHVDGDHTHEGALADLRMAFNRLREGGAILADDYKSNPRTKGQIGVTAAVNEFLAETGWHSLELPSKHGEILIKASI